MSPIAISSLLVVAAVTVGVSALDYGDPGFVPLAEKRFTYPDLPYKVDPTTGRRGTQYGYNLCNSTTEGPESLCQTAFVNAIDDWCIWAPPEGPATIGETEGEAVAWCTKPGRGTRLIPEGVITGVQFLRAPAYLEAIVFFDQTYLNIQADDYGGEMDPHGADLRGNPLGGLVFSNSLPQSGNGANTTFVQVVEWHNFVGSNHSCFKVCDPMDPHAADYCEHRFDRIGVSYTCPNNAKQGVFEMCDSDNQDFPGIYTLSGGTTATYTQPPESLGVITTMPYTARVPASSNCVTFQSTDLFAALPTNTAKPSSSSSGTAAPTAGASGASGSANTAASRTGTAGATSSTASPTGASSTNGAGAVHSSLLATIAGAAFAAVFFA